MRSCVDFLSLPFQTKQGKYLERSLAVLPDGAVALLNFADQLFVIGGRSFNNSDLAMTARWADRTIYLNGADGIDTTGGRTRADLLPGIYDLVKVDAFGGEILQNVVVANGYDLVARAGQEYVQLLYAFPAGTKTLAELEAYNVPINVQSDWSEANTSAAAYIQNKPNFVTEADVMESVFSGAIGEEIDDRVEAITNPILAAVTAANVTAAAALVAANRPFQFYTAAGPHDAAVSERIYCDTTANAISIVLPITPADGNAVEIARIGANAVTLDRNGETIAGIVDDLTIDEDLTIVRLTFVDSTWRVERGKIA